MGKKMRMIILTSLLAIALLGAVLAAIGVHGSTLVSMCDKSLERESGPPKGSPDSGPARLKIKIGA